MPTRPRSLIQPRPNLRKIPLDPWEDKMVEIPLVPIRRFNWLLLYLWLGIILSGLLFWACVLLLMSWWVGL